MRPAFIDADQLAQLLPIADAIDALQETFSGPLPETPPRTHNETAAGQLLLMPAIGSDFVGVKVVTVGPENPSRGRPVVQATYVLFSGDTLTPVAVMDGAALTALRTSAVSGLATRHLAIAGASSLVIFGAGVQAKAHLDAMAAVRPVSRVRVVSRTAGPAEALARRGSDMGLDSAVAGTEAVAEADLVCTCTTSPEPLFDGSLLKPGAHVNAVGAYTPATRELDDEAIRRGRLVVETKEAALAEAGDVLIPLERGAIDPGDIIELPQVVRGDAGRDTPEDITVFKSVGVAFEDLTVASAVYERFVS